MAWLYCCRANADSIRLSFAFTLRNVSWNLDNAETEYLMDGSTCATCSTSFVQKSSWKTPAKAPAVRSWKNCQALRSSVLLEAVGLGPGSMFTWFPGFFRLACTSSSGYPSHLRPVDVPMVSNKRVAYYTYTAYHAHFKHAGFVSSHLTRRPGLG